MLHSVLKGQDEAVSFELVVVRILETASIFASVTCLMTSVYLHRGGAGEDAVVTSQALAVLRDWIFATEQGLLPAINALLLGSLPY